MKIDICKGNISLFVILATILVASSFSVVYSNSVIYEKKEESLPDFLLNLAEIFSNGNVTKLVQIKQQMIEQEKRNKKRFGSTMEPVRDLPFSESRDTCYLNSVEWTWEYEGGYANNEENMVGTMDWNFAHLHADEMDAEVFVAGEMSSSTAGGDVYIYGKKGPHTSSGWENTVFMFISNDTSEEADWQYLGHNNLTYSYPLYYPIGSPTGTFSAVIVGCYSGLEDYENCASVDMVWATSS